MVQLCKAVEATIVTCQVIDVEERDSPFLECLGPHTFSNIDSRTYKTEKILLVRPIHRTEVRCLVGDGFQRV